MNSDEKSDISAVVTQDEIKCHYRYEPTISQTQLIIEVADNAKVSNELIVLIEKLRRGDNFLTTQEEGLYKHLLASIPSTETGRSIMAKPVLERRNVVIKITKSYEENKEILGKKNNNLTGIVTHFKGKRLEELRQMIIKLKQEASGLTLCAITGVAGCGKSELAKAYAWELPQSSHVFRWRLDPDPDNTDNRATKVLYRQAYSELLYNFRIQATKAYEAETPEQINQRVLSILWQRINQYSEWIVIFDNAGSYGDIEPYLPVDPAIRGHILVTTQNPKIFIGNANFSINTGLDEKEAVQLLEDISQIYNDRSNNAVDLVNALDCSPLGIRVAASYIQNLNYTFEKYIQLLQNHIDKRFSDPLERSLLSQAVEDRKRTATLWNAIMLSIDRVKQENPKLLNLLKYCAFLDNDNIPEQLLLELFKYSENNIELTCEHITRCWTCWCLQSSTQRNDGSMIEHRFKTMIFNVEQNYSILTYNSVKRSYHLHRTTQLILRALLASPVLVIQQVTSVILRIYPYDEYSMVELKKCQLMFTHFLSLNERSKPYPILDRERTSLLLILGQISYRFSHISQGLRYLNEAWDMAQNSSNLEIKVQILQYMGYLEINLKQFEKSRETLTKAIQIASLVYPPTDWHLAWIQNYIGYNLRCDPASSLEQSLNAYEQAVDICRNVNLEDRDYQLTRGESYRGIGYCLGQMQEFAEAISILGSAWDIFKIYLQESDPNIASIYLILGSLGLVRNPECFEDVGVNYDTSLKYIKLSLNIQIDGFGPYDIDVADSYNWLSLIVCAKPNISDMGDFKEALKYRDQEIEIYNQLFGNMCQELVASYYWRARILHKLQRFTEAWTQYEHCITMATNYRNNKLNWIEMSKDRLREVKTQIDKAAP